MTAQRRSVVVTGGAGFIGSAVIRHLIGQTDWTIVNIDRLSYASSPAALEGVRDHDRYRFRQMDIRDGAAVSALLAEFRPLAVLHLAAETHVDRSIDGPAEFVEHNLIGTFRLLEAVRGYWSGLAAAEAQAFRFIHVSTDEVFGSLEDGDPAFDPDTPYRPRSPYSATKAGSDHLARAWMHTWGLPVIVTNCSNNYGPFQFPEKLIPLMILRGLAGETLPVYGTGGNLRDWIHVEDHARGLTAALERGVPGETYLFGCGEECSNLETVGMICDLLDARDGLGFPRRTLIRHVADRPGHDFRYSVNADSTCARLGWRPETSFRAGLAQTIDWYLANEDWWKPILSGRYDTRRLGAGIR